MSDILKYKEYIGSAEVDVAAGVCHGRLLFIRDVVTYSADAPQGLQAAFEEAVDDYLETCEDLNRKPEKPCNGTFNVRIPPEMHMAANIVARNEGMSLNALVKDAVAARIGSQTIRHEHNHNHTVTVTAWQDVSAILSKESNGAKVWSH